MRSDQFIKKIRFYALISFLIPLIAINSCMLFYKLLGHFWIYTGINWNEKEIEYTFNELALIRSNSELRTFANCPKYEYREFYITTDNKVIEGHGMLNRPIDEQRKIDNLIENLVVSNKVKSIIFKQGKIKNDLCVKNYRFLYLLLNNFSALDKILTNIKDTYPYGFAKIKNPYFYGEVSISRTARFFPAILIFKSLIILSALLS